MIIEYRLITSLSKNEWILLAKSTVDFLMLSENNIINLGGNPYKVHAIGYAVTVTEKVATQTYAYVDLLKAGFFFLPQEELLNRKAVLEAAAASVGCIVSYEYRSTHYGNPPVEGGKNYLMVTFSKDGSWQNDAGPAPVSIRVDGIMTELEGVYRILDAFIGQGFLSFQQQKTDPNNPLINLKIKA
jgi:hypothetical protein